MGSENLQDQYINHIMNETGATVLLKGGACEGSCSEGGWFVGAVGPFLVMF